MKIFLSLLLAAVICLPASLVVYAAAPSLSISAPDSVKPGETFQVKISVNDNPGIATYKIVVSFDTSKLELVDAENSGKAASQSVTLNIQQGDRPVSDYGEVVAFFSRATNFKTSGEYLTVTLKAKSSAAGSAGVVAEMEQSFNQKYESVSFDSASKTIAISSGGQQGGNDDTPTTGKTIELKDNAKNIKYLKGYSDGTFRPNQAATRYEVVEALAKVFDINVTPKASGLTDVDSKYATQVNLFTTAGIIDGFPDKTFGGNQNITRAQFCKIIAVMMDLNIKNPKNGGFKDVSGWAKVYIDACAEAGLVKGKDEAKKLFDPSANITRAELATLVNRITGAMDSGTSCKYPDVIKGKWYYGWVAAAAE